MNAATADPDDPITAARRRIRRLRRKLYDAAADLMTECDRLTPDQALDSALRADGRTYIRFVCESWRLRKQIENEQREQAA